MGDSNAVSFCYATGLLRHGLPVRISQKTTFYLLFFTSLPQASLVCQHKSKKLSIPLAIFSHDLAFLWQCVEGALILYER